MVSTRSTRRLSTSSISVPTTTAKSSSKSTATLKKPADLRHKTKTTSPAGKDRKVSFNQFAREYPIDICQPPSPPTSEKAKLPLSRKSSRAGPSSPSSFGKPSPRTATPKDSRFASGPLRSNGLGLSFARSDYKLLFGEPSVGKSSEESRKVTPPAKAPRYRRASQNRSAKSRFSRPRKISTTAPSPETPDLPSSPPPDSNHSKTKITVRATTVQKAERVVKRQKNLTRRISELSRLLLEVIDQVHDVERAVVRAEEDVEWEVAEVGVLIPGDKGEFVPYCG
ncbi:hypothetical protein Slin15195_G065920 [Septoria linicola]|uniref:Uncharacterized protein n=1 Tax=Septoria linicola TaxID=215465 RepID=A0A9Q9AU67_9PEZI|nr:hypothetical protein Slin15195_G065920 [Septoria linicola]